MPARQTRNLIRIFVGTTLCAALVACATSPIPEDLPAVAFQQAGFYRLQVALLVFYGLLLLITPVFSGLIHGRLPIEISTRGAKFAEGAERSTKLDEAAIGRLEGTIAELEQALASTEIETKRLHEIAASDSRQQGVDSNR
jgi:hypothetical protein